MTPHRNMKQQILDEAEDLGIPRKDLMVLTTDPYFVGTDADYRNARWAADLWDQMMRKRRKPIHIRGFHYWVQSRRVKKPHDGKLYGDDPIKDWRWMIKACQVARYLGVGEWENLVDLKHPNVQDYDYYTDDTSLYGYSSTIDEVAQEEIEEVIDNVLRRMEAIAPNYTPEAFQTYHTEVWVEKSSMGHAIEPICRKYRAAYQPLVGQSSVEKVYMLYQRVMKAARVGKKVRIFYIADWDRYGWSMVTAVARKLEYSIVTNGQEADVKMQRIALNDDQIKKYKLPMAPKNGEKVVELDALDAIHPGELQKIIEKEIARYFSDDERIVREENRKIRERLREILEERVRPVLEEALGDIGLDKVDVDIRECLDPEFEVPDRDYEVDEHDHDWVYDSSRDWFDQLEQFKLYKESREEEAA